MTKYMTPFAGNQRAQMTAASAVSLSSAATKAFGSCDVINRDPPPSTAAIARPTTALPRYMQDTAVSRQRTFFLNRPGPVSRLQPPKSARPILDSENVNQAKGVDSGRWNILRRSQTVVEASDAAATKNGGLPGDLPPQGPTRTEPLVEKISRDQHREVVTIVDAAEGPVVHAKGGIVIEEVTVPLDVSTSGGSGNDQRPLPVRFGGGVNVGPIPPGYFLQQTESGIVRLPDISYSSAAAAASGSLRRVSSELPFIGSVLSVQRERERTQEQPEDEIRGASFFSSSSSSSSPTEDYDPDCGPSVMDNHRGPSTTSGVEGPLKRSMPSTTTLSSGSGNNAVAVDRPRRPSKVQLTDGTTDNNSRMVVSGGSTTNRQNDDVFLPPRTTRQTSTRDDRCPPSTNNAVKVTVDRRSSMPLTRHKDSAKDTLSPPISGLSEAALRILDEINMANDLTRVQNNLERFQRTTRLDQLSTPRLSLGQAQQPVRGDKKNSWAAADAVAGRQRRPPPAAAAASGGNGLLRTSKSQPNLIRDLRLQQHQQPSHQQQSGVRNPVVNGSRNVAAQRRMKPQLKSEDLEDEVDDYDEEDERTETMKRERILRWLIGANEYAEPPPIPSVIEEERPTQTDNAIHIVYNG